MADTLKLIKMIERLEADNKRLRAALLEIDKNFDVLGPQTRGSVLHLIMDITRRALKGE